MNCDASCKEGSPGPPPSPSEVQELQEPVSLPPPFPLLSQSILAKFGFLCSQLSAHGEKDIQRGRRVGERRGWF